MKMQFVAVTSILGVMALLGSGCVAQKTSTVHNTLKGDNSVVEAMSGTVDMIDSGFVTLSDLTDAFSRELASKTEARKIYLDRANIRDVSTGDVANFSSYLQNELEASLSNEFSLQVMPEAAEILLGATFQRYGNQIKIFLKYHSADYSLNKTFDYGIERSRLPADSLKESLRSKAYQLATHIIEDDLERKIYVKPLESVENKSVGPFSKGFTRFLQTEIIRMHRQVEIVAEKPLQEKLSDTRAVKKKSKKVKALETSDAFFADANNVLEGDYIVNGDQVMVTLLLKDLEGHVENSASIDIERSLIKMPLEDKTAVKLADLVDRKTEDSGGAVKVSTNRSGDFPVYHSGDNIVFYAQVKQPLFLYIYAVDSTGDVSLLYPYGDATHNRKTYPGSLVAIPDEADDFEMIASRPFGMDAVKIFASPIQLPTPELSSTIAAKSYRGGVRGVELQRKDAQKQLVSQRIINPHDLVDYYRGLAKRNNVEVYEDSLMFETRF